MAAGLGLSPDARALLSGHFSQADLDRVRIIEQNPLPITGLGLVLAARRMGWNVLDPQQIAAITFDHVVATRAPTGINLLFHEMVHVVQFRLLGVNGFARQYAQGFFAKGSYAEIPLERQAFEMEDRFALGAEPFEVEAEVARGMENNGS